MNAIYPVFDACPTVTKDKISRVLGKSFPSSAPGPDTIPYSVWKQLHKLHPDILLVPVDPLVQRGYHPAALKCAEGVVLDKPGKPSDDTLMAY